jgi:hypothetical protein
LKLKCAEAECLDALKRPTTKGKRTLMWVPGIAGIEITGTFLGYNNAKDKQRKMNDFEKRTKQLTVEVLSNLFEQKNEKHPNSYQIRNR